MWSQFRTATNILFPRPPHQLINLKIFSRFLHFKLNNTFSSQSDVDSFLPWLQSKSGYQISSLLSIKNSIYGNSLFASKYIHAGDCILKVPFTVHLTSNNLLPEVNSLLPDHVGHVARLAIVVLIEQIKGQESEWAPYISCLPKPGELHSAIFWSEEELEMVRPSVLYEETIELKAQLEKEYLALRPALDQFPNLFKDIKYEDFMHAFALVASRAWGSCKEVSLIPFADFLNHDGASREILLSDKDKQISEVIADRDYAPGKQILVRYGNFANFELLLGFGFALSCNKYEQVQIRMNVSQHDPLHTMKLELLHKHTVPIVTNTSTLDSCTKSFIIKEIRSAGGKGKGIPQSLRAFARVLCAASLEELKDLELEAVKTDGRVARRPLKDMSREIESHLFLLSQIEPLIRDYDASIEFLKIVNSRYIGGKFSLRKQMAQDLLSGELRILKSASAWLENYCCILSKEIQQRSQTLET